MNTIAQIMNEGRKVNRPISQLIYQSLAESMIPAPQLRLNKDLYFATRFKIKNKEGRIVPLILNRAQYDYLMHRTGRDIILKARQLGFSTLIQADNAESVFRGRGINTVTIADSGENTRGLVDMFDIFYEHMPVNEQPLRKGRYPFGFRFPTKNSLIYIGTAHNRKWGRSKTVLRVHASEFAYWPDSKTTLGGITESVPEDPKIDTSVVLESTANGAQGYFYELCMAAMKGQGIWKLHFYPWWWDDNYKLPLDRKERIALNTEEEQLKERVLREDGVDLTLEHFKWRRRKQDSLKGLFKQEYPETIMSAFLTSGRPRFDLERMNERRNVQTRKPIVQTLPYYTSTGDTIYQIRIYEKPIPGRDYVIGADTAEGIIVSVAGDTDYCAAVVRDRVTNRQVATIHGKLEPIEFATALHKIGKYYNWAVLGVERNNHGHAVNGYLVNGVGQNLPPYPNVYIHEDDRVGWPTTPKTRPVMIDDLAAEYAVLNHYWINDDQIINEAMSFVIHANGKAEATLGSHDDLIFADAIAGQLRNRPQQYTRRVHEPLHVGDF